MSRQAVAVVSFFFFAFMELGPVAVAQPAAGGAPPPDCKEVERACPEQEAEEEESTASEQPLEDVQFSGQLFTRYGWNVTGTGDEKNFNSFALDRWYFTARASLAENLSFRGTTDIVSTDGEGGLGYTVIVKYAYFDWQMRPWLNLRAGLHQTGWENYVTGVWGYRGVAKTMAHYQGHLSTSDLGATLSAELPDDWGTAAVGVHNGQGYRRLEADQFKDFSGRVILTPFAGGSGALMPVRVGGHGYRGQYSDGRTRLRWGGLLAYESAGHTLALNYEYRKDGEVRGMGLSAFGEWGLGALPRVGAFSLIGLVDVYDPSDAVDEDRSIRSVTGVAYQPMGPLTLSVNYQQVRGETSAFERYDGTTSRVDGSVLFQAIVKY